jgi:hypothetical protein
MSDLKGTLVADFSSFKAAVDASIVSLDLFEGDATKVAASLTRMGQSFSGTKTIQDAQLMAKVFTESANGATLTSNELARMGAVGSEAMEKLLRTGEPIPANLLAMVDAAAKSKDEIAKMADEGKKAGTTFETLKGIAGTLAGAFGIAFSVGAVVNFGKSLIDDAGALVDLNTKTGISIEQLQRFAFVGSQSKVSVEQLADASFKLGVNLAGNAKGSVRQAVADLGMQYDVLKTQSPDDQFNATIAALEKMTDKQEQNRLGVEVFGKSWATIAPAVAAGFSEMAKAATVSTDAQVKAINDMGAAWDRHVSNVKAGVTAVLGSLVLADEGFKQLTLSQKAQSIIAGLLGGNTMALAVEIGKLSLAEQTRSRNADITLPKEKLLLDSSADYTAQLTLAQTQIAALSAAETAGITAALQLGKSHDEIAVAFSISDAALALFIDRQAAAKVAADKLAHVTEVEASMGENWRGTLAKLTPEIHAQALAAKQAGADNEYLMTKYSITSTVVAALAKETVALTDAERVKSIGALANSQLESQLRSLSVKESGTARDIQIADLHKWADDFAARLKTAGVDVSTFYANLQAVVTATTAQILDHSAGLAGHNSNLYQEALNKIADNAEQDFLRASTAESGYSTQFILHLREVADAARDAAGHMWESFEQAGEKSVVAIGKISDAASKAAADAKAILESLTSAAKELAGRGYSTRKGDTTNEERGFGATGGPHHEAPRSDFGLVAAPSVALTTGGGGGVTNHFYVNGDANSVAATILQTLQQGQQLA